MQSWVTNFKALLGINLSRTGLSIDTHVAEKTFYSLVLYAHLNFTLKHLWKTVYTNKYGSHKDTQARCVLPTKALTGIGSKLD